MAGSAALAWALLVGCAADTPQAAVSTPVTPHVDPSGENLIIEPVPTETRPDGREPLSATALTAADLKRPSISALAPGAAERAMTALNNVVGPCDPCMKRGMSLARCALDRADAAACANIPGLIDHLASRAAAGDDLDTLVARGRYEDPWFPPAGVDHLGGPRASMGSPDAPVVMLVAVDYGSPFMEKSRELWPTLVAGAAGRLRVEVLHAPVPGRHPGAEFASRAALAATPDKAWALHHLLLRDHKGLSPPNLKAAITEVGLDPGEMKIALDRPEITAALNGERALVEARGVRSSPTVFINGYRLRGLREPVVYQAFIERELETARPRDPAREEGR